VRLTSGGPPPDSAARLRPCAPAGGGTARLRGSAYPLTHRGSDPAVNGALL